MLCAICGAAQRESYTEQFQNHACSSCKFLTETVKLTLTVTLTVMLTLT